MSTFFVNRPIFAWVIAIIIMMFGILAIKFLPMSQYPDVAPPSVKISATYTGASAETIENSVTQIIEQQLTGLDGLLYFESSSSSNGTANITVTFKQGTDPDTAQQQVQNKINQITSRLPTSVQQMGVNVTKAQTDFLLIAAIYDETDRSTPADISDYLVSNLQESLSRLEGVGSVQVFGSQYAMRIWLDPFKLKNYNLNPSDIVNAIRTQNIQVSAGKIGDLPTINGQELNATVTSKSMLKDVDDFKKIIVKSGNKGDIVYLSDVARVELGNENYGNETRLNGHPASGMAVMLASGANALNTAERVHAFMHDFSKTLPDGYKISYPRDSSEFVKISINEVYHTLFEAIILVIIVMFIFLQDWRTTLIPTIAVPVVLLGTFGVLFVLGLSINTLTMFALVLSIGLLVDDAIVVVENVERIMREENLSPKEATVKSMKEITGALIGIATVLSVVFIPMAFFSGSTGVIYKQFSVTIVASMILSVIVAITLTPALCATMLKKHSENKRHRKFSDWFNRNFDIITFRYSKRISQIVRNSKIFLPIYVFIIIGLLFSFSRLSTGFLPNEDQGSVMVQFTLPTGASFERTLNVAKQVEQYFLTQEKDNVDVMFTISGFSFGSSGQNTGMAFIALKDWSVRKGPENSANAIAMRAMRALSQVKDARVFSMSPPAIQGLGQTDGLSFQIKAKAGTERDELIKLRDELISQANKTGELANTRFDGTDNASQLYIDIDSKKALNLGLSLSDIDNTITNAWAGNYVNDFIDRGRVKKVYVQGDKDFRSKPEDLGLWHVRNSSNKMTPFSSFASTHWNYGPELLSRYNGFASYNITANANSANGISSGKAMDKLEDLANHLSNDITYEWSGLSYQEKLASGQAGSLYAISIFVVFLCLAALYESWSIPFSVLMVIPLGLIGAVLATMFRGLENDVYFQVALLTTIGLSSKNAILIIEFAEDAYKRGLSIYNSAIEGAKLRLRPILMTSLAFIAGVMPLALSSGAGANSRISIGTAIVGGTFTGTALALFFVPLFFVIIKKLFKSKQAHN